MSNNDETKKSPDTKPKLKGLALLKYRQKQLEARIADAEAREKNHERKKDTRRKILIGAYYLDQARKVGTLDDLAYTLDDYLKRDSDRALFGLPSLEEKAIVAKGKPLTVNLTQDAIAKLSATEEA